jgi:glycosyltransferase involved in cell wall biosynthesis
MIKPKISIIIPIYNVEQYLERCIESILFQSYKNYEIILVNDGSTDNSSLICDKYSEKFSFIKAIHKNNGGLSDARNMGINHATGDYILFIDSDDFIADNSLININDTIQEDLYVDVIFLNAFKYFNNGNKIPLGDGYAKSNIFNKPQNEVFKHIASLPKFPGSACTKLIRRSIIVEYNLYFEKGRTAEDLDWCMQLYLKANRFNYCNCDYYYYRQQRANSIGDSVTLKKVEDLFYVIKKWVIQVKENTYSEELNVDIYSCAAYEYSILLLNYAQLNKKEKELIKGEIKSFSWLLNYRKDKPTLVIKLFYMVFGTNYTSFFLKFYLQFRYKKLGVKV